MARDSLHATLASIAASSYRPLEVVIVNAKGGEHGPPPFMGAAIDVRLHNLSGPSLDRAIAANAGLSECSGEFALLLDDDDLLDAGHIQTLATSLMEHPAALASYTGVRLANSQGRVIREINEEWEPDRLLGMNFLPIHAVMFRMSCIRGKVAFDPDLRLMEDWDFWRQLALLGDFVRVPGCSATYNLDQGESGLSGQRNISVMMAAHSAVLERIRKNNPLAPSRALFWFDTALTHVQGEKKQLEANLDSANRYISTLETRINTIEANAAKWETASKNLTNELNNLHSANSSLQQALNTTTGLLASTHASLIETQANLAATQSDLLSTKASLTATEEALASTQAAHSMILASTSWRATAPLRALITKIRILMK